MSLRITKEYSFSKVGLNEVDGLKDALQAVIAPIQESIKDRIYWSQVDVTESEYKARDGFIPYSSNCGGLEIVEIIPKCEEYEFGFLEFGECEDCQSLSDKNEHNRHGEIAACGYDGQECASDSEGHLDAKLRVWLKFEGIDSNGAMQFYLYCGGGNGDAPYFRTSGETTVFEASFEAKSIAGVKRAASKHVKALLKAIK